MERETADRVVGVVILAVLLSGVYGAVRVYSIIQGSDRIDMALPMPAFGMVFMTVIVSGIILVSYILIRGRVFGEETSKEATSEEKETADGEDETDPVGMLPEDERRIIEPILQSPGLTQVELRGRSDFSKAKVSQTVTELEDRGLVYREKQGRTYRVYPGEPIKE